MKTLLFILLYFLTGTIIAAIRLYVYNVDLENFADLSSYDDDDEQLYTMFIILGWPIYVLMKCALYGPKLVVKLIRLLNKKEDEQ